MAERAPEARRLDEQLDPDLALERLVIRGVLIPHHCIGDVRTDVERRRPGGPVTRALVSANGAPREGGPRKAELSGAVAGKIERRVAPAKSIGGCSRRRVGEHREDEALRIPEGVPVVPGAGEALRADRALLGPRAGLQRVEEREANRLLQLGVALELDIGAPPEIVQIGALGLEQPIPAGVPRFGERSDGGIPDGRERAPAGGAVGQELDHAQPFSRGEVGGDRHPADVGGALDRRLLVVGAFHEVIHRGRETQLAGSRRVDENHAIRVGGVLLGLQRRSPAPRPRADRRPGRARDRSRRAPTARPHARALPTARPRRGSLRQPAARRRRAASSSPGPRRRRARPTRRSGAGRRPEGRARARD